MTTIPTDESLAAQIQAAIDHDERLKQCISCRHYNKVSRDCPQTKMKMMPYVCGCNGKYFETAMEFLLAKVKDDLKGQALECDKMENMLALSITTANSASCFFSRLIKMIKSLREKEDDRQAKRMLYKDLGMTEEMMRGMDMITDKLSSLYETVDARLEEVDQLYRLYVEPQTNRIFTHGGRFDYKQSDGHLNNSMHFCKLLMDYTIACICNDENDKIVFDTLRGLRNGYPYALTHKDADSFVLKGFEG